MEGQFRDDLNIAPDGRDLVLMTRDESEHRIRRRRQPCYAGMTE